MGLFTTNKNELDLGTDFYFPTSKRALIIFTKNPELGKCKTRLAKDIGEKAALEIYITLLKQTVSSTERITADKFVFYTNSIHKNDLWDDALYRKKMQNGKDLGIRMHNAFTETFNSGYQKAIIIGCDIYNLTQDHIERAFAYLDDNDVVIGPAKDGGYYLLGLKTMNNPIFLNKSWGYSSVLEDTLQDLKSEKVHLLEELSDIDTFDDIKNISEFKKFV